MTELKLILTLHVTQSVLLDVTTAHLRSQPVLVASVGLNSDIYRPRSSTAARGPRLCEATLA